MPGEKKHITIGELARHKESDPAIKDDFRSFNWGELDRRISALGQGLQGLGLKELSHVGIVVSNRIEFLESYIATMKAGFTQTPVKTSWTAEQISYLLKDAKSRAVITDIPAAREAAAALDIPVVDLDDDYDIWLDAQNPEPLPVGGCGYRIPYTSGTTGQPKGVSRIVDVEQPFEEWAKQQAAGAEGVGFPRDGWHLMVSQMFHGAPTTFALGSLLNGAPMKIVSRWSADKFADWLTPDVTATIMVPTMFRQLLALDDQQRAAIDFSSLEFVMHGGESCPIELKRQMIDWWGPVFSEYYGFTEGGMTLANSRQWPERPGTVGLPIGNMEVSVVGEDGKKLGPNEEGELCFLRPEGAYFKYVNDEQKTSKAYQSDGSFGVGDIGWLDEDGYLFISGRSAELIVAAGVNIYPAEIEAVLFEVGGVLDAGVAAGPDPERGEQPVAFLALKEGFDSDAVAAAAEELCKEKLAGYMNPRRFVIKDELPRDPTGKLLRKDLRAELWGKD